MTISWTISPRPPQAVSAIEGEAMATSDGSRVDQSHNDRIEAEVKLVRTSA